MMCLTFNVRFVQYRKDTSRMGKCAHEYKFNYQTGFAPASFGVIDGVRSVNDIRSYDVLDI